MDSPPPRSASRPISGRMSSVPKSLDPLAAQRLLLAGLLGVAALSAVLLWGLRSGSDAPRGRRATDAPPVESPLSAVQVPLRETAAGPAGGAVSETERTAVPAHVQPEAPAPAFDPGTLMGRVLGAGLPLAGVELRAFPAELERSERRRPASEGKSDADGRFHLAGLVPHRRYALQLQHPDFLPSEEALFPGHAEELELERAASVSGSVRLASTRAPLAGVEVSFERWNFGPEGLRPRVSATSDSEGRWRLPWAEPGVAQFLVVWPGHLPERREFQVTPEGGEGYEILLGEGAPLELELFDLASGNVLADTEVLADGIPVRTDARGHLSVSTGGRDERVRLSLELPGGCLTQGRVDPAALQGFLRVPLTRGCTVRGSVRDGRGAPIEGARLRMSGGGRLPARYALPEGFWLNPRGENGRSEADGSFVLAGLPPREGRVELRVQHPEHPPGRSEPFALAELGLTVATEVVLERGACVRGTLRLDGEPAALRVYWSGSHAAGWTRANDRGDYRILGIPAGEVSLRARLDEEDEDVSRAEDRVLVLAEDEELELDLDLASHRTRIRGRVLDRHGDPVAGAEVVASLAEESGEEGSFEDEPQDRSDAEGRFELLVPDRPGLSFDVVAESGPRRAEALGVRAGAELELVFPPLTTVVLRVIDSVTRQPLPSFLLFWRNSDAGRFERLRQGGRSLSPGPDGTFVAELPCGRLDLVASARPLGLVSARHDGVRLDEASSPHLDFELEPGVELELVFEVAPEHAELLGLLRRGRYALANDEQWEERGRGGAWFQEEVRNAQTLRVDAGGVAHLTGLASGNYRFINAPRGFVLRPSRFELPPVAVQRQKVRIEPVPPAKPRPRKD